MKNITWNKIEPGQIVTFAYKSKGESTTKRTVLCINPEIKYLKKDGVSVKFFVGIQLKAVGQKQTTPAELTQIMNKLGGIEVEGGSVGAKLPENVTKIDTALIVRDLKQYKKYYRTYDLKQCKSKRVVLETKYQKIPKVEVKKLENMGELNED